MKTLITDPTILELINRDNLCDISVLEERFNDPFFLIRALVAMHPNATVDLVNQAVDDHNLSVVCAAVYRDLLSDENIRRLSGHSEECVRASVACNPKLPAELREVLRIDPSRHVRETVTRKWSQPSTP